MADTGRKEQQALVLKQLPITLTTAQVQEIWQSGQAVRKWAGDNHVRLTVRKGEVDMADTGKRSTASVMDEVNKAAERVKARL